MQPQRLSDIRSTFLNYFQKHNHSIVPSAPLVPDDPSLMFVNAGMVPFKDIFTGKATPDYTKATSAQKCLRAGGKHNDLDNVGYTSRHHTFFEMLGNFSFGDYFKEEAIVFAWDIITKVFEISKDKLLITVHSSDQEARDIWRKVTGFGNSKIITIDGLDNFWSMGDVGPCGPCTEIFYDHGPNVVGGPPGSSQEDGDRYIEIWNLVFMQYDSLASGEKILLPKPCVDTGMGLERMAAVLQGVQSNFQIDLFQQLIKGSIDIAGNPDHLQSHQVIADHLRATAFLIADGVMPSNEGRGYVLRRIMRRAMRHNYLMGQKKPSIYRLLPILNDLMGNAYPELNRANLLISETLRNEEDKFLETLGRGMAVLDDEIQKVNSKCLSGEVAFKLYDTYGFPLDLTEDVLRQHKIKVDHEGFDRAMQHQKQLAKASWSGSGDVQDSKEWFTLASDLKPTDFCGYEELELKTKILGIISENHIVGSISNGDAWIVLEKTPFYAEAGGQVSDKGELTINGSKYAVLDCQRFANSLVAHKIVVGANEIKLNDCVVATVNKELRAKIAANHSATHLLHGALRRVLGDHVVQKGSLVDANKLRFDFTHSKALKPEEIKAVIDIVNQEILSDHKVNTEISTPEKAMQAGVLGLFGEKYGDQVRVLSIGYSQELCGGTHVKNTGNIGLFYITQESGVSAGVRRIEAITNTAILNYFTKSSENLNHELEVQKKQLKQALKDLDAVKKEIAMHKVAEPQANGNESNLTTLGAYPAIIRHLIDVKPQELRNIAEQLKKSLSSGIVLVTTVFENKVGIVVAITKDLSQKLDAVKLVKTAAISVGGQGGGGRADMAQAGGNQPESVSSIVQVLNNMLC